VTICWFYVKNCIFVHITNNFFLVTGPPSETPGLPLTRKVEVLEPPLVWTMMIINVVHRTLLFMFTLSPAAVQTTVINMFVCYCLSVCMSVHSHILKPRVSATQFAVHVATGHGSVLR